MQPTFLAFCVFSGMKDYFSLYFIIEDKKSIKSRLVSWDKCLVTPLMGQYVSRLTPNGQYVSRHTPNGQYVSRHTPNGQYVSRLTPNGQYVSRHTPNGQYVSRHTLMASTCLVTPPNGPVRVVVDGYNYVNKFDYLKLSTIYVALLNWVYLSTDCVSYFRLNEVLFNYPLSNVALLLCWVS